MLYVLSSKALIDGLCAAWYIHRNWRVGLLFLTFAMIDVAVLILALRSPQ